MTNPTDRRPLRAVTEPGGPSAMTSPRAGSTNHQGTTHPTSSKETRRMDIEQTEHPAATRTEDSDELCPRCELREAIRATVAMVLTLSLLWLLRADLIGQLHQCGRWAWFTAGSGAALLFLMATATIERLYVAAWAMWLLTHPVPAWVPGWAVPHSLRSAR